MRKVEKIEEQIRKLSDPELAEFRQWFAEFDAQAWDQQIEADVRSGKLDALNEATKQIHKNANDRRLLKLRNPK